MSGVVLTSRRRSCSVAVEELCVVLLANVTVMVVVDRIVGRAVVIVVVTVVLMQIGAGAGGS